MRWQELKFWLGIALVLVGIGIPVFFATKWLEIDPRFALIGIPIALYVVLGIAVERMRQRLQSDVESMSDADRESFLASNEDLRQASTRPKGPSVKATIWVGLICINGPAVPLLIVPLFLYLAITVEGDSIGKEVLEEPALLVFSLVLGFVLSWCWWSVGVTVWRKWAAKRGLDEDELQYQGENASLLWPSGHFFEKTEFGCILKRLRGV